MPSAPGVASDLFDLAVKAGCVVFAVWLMWKGPTRQLKLALALFVVLFVARQVVVSGSAVALVVVAMLLVTNVAVMAGSMLLVRYRVHRTLSPATPASCPAYALGPVAELTRRFEELGFRAHEDRQSTWKMAGGERKTFVRFLAHGAGQSWVEIQAMDSPRSVGRMLTSLKKDGRALLTCDRQANQELLRDPETLVQRVGSGVSCADMVVAHDTFVMKTPGVSRTIEDPVAADVDAYDRWVQHLIRSGQVRADGGWFTIRLRRALPIALRVLGAWFK